MFLIFVNVPYNVITHLLILVPNPGFPLFSNSLYLIPPETIITVPDASTKFLEHNLENELAINDYCRDCFVMIP